MVGRIREAERCRKRGRKRRENGGGGGRKMKPRNNNTPNISTAPGIALSTSQRFPPLTFTKPYEAKDLPIPISQIVILGYREFKSSTQDAHRART